MKVCALRLGTLILILLLNSYFRAGATGYTLTINVIGAGTVARNPTNTIYPAGATVTLTAISNDPSWYFANWSGDASGSTNPLNVMMDTNKVITATFQQFGYFTLTLVTNGQGSISLSPSGGAYPSNTMVTVTATPASGWVFTGWSGDASGNANPLSVTMMNNLLLTGNFAQLPAFDVLPQNQTNSAGSTANFTSHAVGTGPLSYQWYYINSPLAGATSGTLMLPNAQLANAGNYWVTATNAYGSVTSSVVVLVLTNTGGSTNVVSVCQEANLRAAIQAGGWVSIDCNGTINLTGSINITKNVILDARNVNMTISGSNAVRLFYIGSGSSFSATNLTLANGSCIVTNNPMPADAGAIYNDGGMVSLTGCTLTNNSAQSPYIGGFSRGGAIFNNGGTLLLYNSSLSDNAVFGGSGPISLGQNGGSGYGGALFTTNGSVSIINCLVYTNLCTEAGGPNSVCFGGAMFVASGTLTISNSTFANNLSLGGISPPTGGPVGAGTAYGGALAAASGHVTIDYSQFTGNTAKGGDASGHTPEAGANGGAIYNSAIMMAESSTFSGNQTLSGNLAYNFGDTSYKGSNGYGGAIYNAGTFSLSRSSVYSNYTRGGTVVGFFGGIANGGDGLGGGIFNASQLTATNSTLALNTAIAATGSPFNPSAGGPGTNGNALGGGVFNAAGATSIWMNVTIASNLCIASGTGFAGTNGFSQGAQVANSNSNGVLELHNSIIAYGGTNGNAFGPITDLGFNISSDGSANFQSGASYNYTDPQLGPLQNNFGPTLTMNLLPSSPAIDFGDGVGAPPTDQRGFPRPNGAGVDIGAVEFYASNIPPPQISASHANGNFMLGFTAYPPASYRLQASSNLSSWIDLETNGPFASVTNVNLSVSTSGWNYRFFRLLVQ
jgi:hypothetical protein